MRFIGLCFTLFTLIGVTSSCYPKGCDDFECMVSGLHTNKKEVNDQLPAECKRFYIPMEEAKMCLSMVRTWPSYKNLTDISDSNLFRTSNRNWGGLMVIDEDGPRIKDMETCRILVSSNGHKKHKKYNGRNRCGICSLSACNAPGLYFGEPHLDSSFSDDCKQPEISEHLFFECVNQVMNYIYYNSYDNDVKKRIDFLGDEAELMQGVEMNWNEPLSKRMFEANMGKDPCDLLKFKEEKVAVTDRLKRSQEKTSNTKFHTNIPISSDPEFPLEPSCDPEHGIYFKMAYDYDQSNSIVVMLVIDSKNSEQLKSDCTISKKEVSHRSNLNILIVHVHFEFDICHLELNGSKVRVEKENEDISCTNENVFRKSKMPTIYPSHISNVLENYVICKNGTILKEETVNLFDLDHCVTILISEVYTQCRSSKRELSKCKITKSKSSTPGSTSLHVVSSLSGVLQVKSHDSVLSFDCNKVCNVEVQNSPNVVITCPGGHVHIFSFSDDISSMCPFVNSYLPGRVSAHVCRATKRPIVFYIIIFQLIFGKHIIRSLMLLVEIIFCVILCSLRRVKRRLNPNIQVCIFCEEMIENNILRERHESCSKGICPYCRTPIDNFLIQHVSSCVHRLDILQKCTDTIRQPSARKIADKYKTSGYKKKTITGLNLLILLTLFVLLVSPVSANYVDLRDSIPDEEMFKEFETECVELSDDPLVNSSSKLSVSRGKKTIDLKFHNYQSTFSFTDSSRNIDISWVSSTTQKKTLLISGHTIGEIELEVNTGLIWKISAQGSSEKKTVGIGIKDFYHEYIFKFLYWTADRKITMGTDNTCTGPCKKGCGCNSPNCKSYIKSGIRSWSCNPTWCLGIGTGCSCCWMKAEVINPKIVAAVYDVQYVSTKVIVCLQISKREQDCKVIDHSKLLHLKEYTVRISKVKSTVDKLPDRIMAIFHLDGKRTFDVSRPDKIILNPDICSSNNCEHGDIGDFKFTDFRVVMGKSSDKTIEMSWSGVQQDINCESFHWPTCVSYNVVENLEERFEHMIDNSRTVSKEFYILQQGNQISSNGASNLLLKVRPKLNTGVINIFMSAKNVRFNRDDVPIEVDSFSLIKCNGCRSCMSGATCTFSLSIKNAEKHNIHIESEDKLISVEQAGFEVSRKLRVYEVSIFTSRSASRITLCIENLKRCSTTDKVNLTEPQFILESANPIFKVVSNGTSNKESNWFDFSGLWNLAHGLADLIYHPFELITNSALLIAIFMIATFGFKIFRAMPLKMFKEKKEILPISVSKKGK